MSDFAPEYDATPRYGQQMPGAPPFVPEVSIGNQDVDVDGYSDTDYDETDRDAVQSLDYDLYGTGTSGIGGEADTIGEEPDPNDDGTTVDLGSEFVDDPLVTDSELPASHPARFGRHAVAVGQTVLVDGRTVVATDSPLKATSGVLEFSLDFRDGTPVIEVVEPPPEVTDEYRPPAHPQRVYVDADAQPGFPAWYDADVKDWRARPLQGEVPPDEYEQEVIGRVDRSIVEIGDEVGVDMRGRLQPAKEHHVFPDKTSYVHGIKMRFGSVVAAKLEVNRGFSHPQAGLIWTRQGDAHDDAFGLTHEKIHGVSLEVVKPGPVMYTRIGTAEPVPQYATQRVAIGYQDLCTRPLSEPHGATEFSTDMAANKSMIMNGYGPIDPTYRAIDILGGHAVLETARAYGVKPLEVENKIINGLWTPDRSGMEMVREVLGDERFDTFIHLTATMTGVEAERVAQALGWDIAIDDLVKAGVGKFSTYFDWRRRRYAI